MENIVKLSSLKSGNKTIIKNVDEINEKMNRRLIELGFVKNQKIEILKNFNKAKNMLVCVRGCVLSIDYFIADKVVVYGGGNK